MAADLNESSSRSGRGGAAHRFSQVVSNGPTAIPLKEDVDAAISSVLAADDLSFGQSSLHSGSQAQTIGDARRPAALGVPHRTARASGTTGAIDNASPGEQTSFNHRRHNATNGAGGGVGVGDIDERHRHVPDGVSRPGWSPHNPVRASGPGGGTTQNMPPGGHANRVGGGFNHSSSGATRMGAGGGGVGGDVGRGEASDPGEGRSLLLDWALWPLWGTIDALKWAGGTVNEVAVAPVVRLASPWALLESTVTKVAALTPQRARDLARVIGNLGINAARLIQTSAGGAVWRSCTRATGSFSMAVSSPAGRQLLVDSAIGYVKLAEALDTPEAKNCIQQWAVIVARGCDALASRHSKIFVKDCADAVIRLVELANSQDATDMAGEFIANVAHALEIEHNGGLDRTDAENAAPMPGNAHIATPRLSARKERVASPRPSAAGASSTADPSSPRIWVSDGGDDIGARAPGVVAPSPGGALEASREGAHSLDGLVRDARLARARQESFGVGKHDVADRGAEGGSNVRALGDESEGGTGGNDHEGSSGGGEEVDGRTEPNADGGGGNAGDGSGSGSGGGDGGGSAMVMTATAAELGRRNRINPIPIRQSELTGKTPLSALRPAGDALYSSSVLAGRRKLLDRKGGDAYHSAPSSPTVRSGFPLEANDSTAATALSCVGEVGPVVGSFRRRAFTETEAFGAGGSGGGNEGGGGGGGGGGGREEGTAESESFAAGADGNMSTDGGSEGGGGMSEGSSVHHPPVEYVRHGYAFLPRFSGRAFASILRGQPLGLGQQLEAPQDRSLDDAVARAARFLLHGPSSPSPRAIGVGAVEREMMDAAGSASREFSRSGDSAGPSTTKTAAPGWKQLAFSLGFLFFALDGVLHLCRGAFGGKGDATMVRPSSTAPHLPSSASSPAAASAPSRLTPSIGVCVDGAEDFSGETDGRDNSFRTTFLPPTCQDIVSGTTMAIWATPSGPCLSPTLNVEAKSRWFWGGEASRGPGCAASFRPCSAAELLGDNSATKLAADSAATSLGEPGEKFSPLDYGV